MMSGVRPSCVPHTPRTNQSANRTTAYPQHHQPFQPTQASARSTTKLADTATLRPASLRHCLPWLAGPPQLLPQSAAALHRCDLLATQCRAEWCRPAYRTHRAQTSQRTEQRHTHSTTNRFSQHRLQPEAQLNSPTLPLYALHRTGTAHQIGRAPCRF